MVYANRGWKLIPIWPVLQTGRCGCKSYNCPAVGKHPMIERWQDNSSSDPKQIEEWWNQRPDANVAIMTGEGSGIWSLDVDGMLGRRTMATLTKANPLPYTFNWKTGGGGMQVLFKWPEDMTISNRVSVLDGVDVRGRNGYVLAPPSNHISGKHYKLQCPVNLPVVDAPDWLLSTVTQRQDNGIVLAPGKGMLLINGARNNALFSMGAKLRREFPGIGVEAVQAFLDVVNRLHCMEPLTQGEVDSIVKNLFRYLD